jgi:ppGpp synthetase/RelA/SpoT-type nucleotidyltranferase
MSNSIDQNELDLSYLEREYRELFPVATQAANELYQKISFRLDFSEIVLAFPIESRVKTWASIEDKLRRLKLRIQSLRELNDLVGLRLVTLFRKDALKICKVVEGNFEIIKGENTAERLKPDQFGYVSFHYVIRLAGKTLQPDESVERPDLRAEVQVRTLAQHVWATASHELQYKTKESVPVPLRRSIHRVSALLEVVDDELERLREEHRGYIEHFGDFDDSEDLSIMLLQLLFSELLPERNFVENDDYFGVMIELLHVKVDTKGKVKQLILDERDTALREEQKMIGEMLNEPKSPPSEKAKIRTKGAFLTQVGLVRTMLRNKFGEQYRVFDTRKYASGN